jgi:hypothetical protein
VELQWGGIFGFDLAPRGGERRGQAGSEEGEGAVPFLGEEGTPSGARASSRQRRWCRPEEEDDREWAKLGQMDRIAWAGWVKKNRSLVGPARFGERKRGGLLRGLGRKRFWAALRKRKGFQILIQGIIFTFKF